MLFFSGLEQNINTLCKRMKINEIQHIQLIHVCCFCGMHSKGDSTIKITISEAYDAGRSASVIYGYKPKTFDETMKRLHLFRLTWICIQINTTGVTSGAGTAYPSEAPKFTPGFLWGSCYSIFSFIFMLCRSSFVLLAIVLFFI